MGKRKRKEEEQPEAGGEEEYNVEYIDRAKPDPTGDSADNWTYYVKWEGYPVSENSWIPSGNLTSCGRLVKSFWEQFPEHTRYTSNDEARSSHDWIQKEVDFCARQVKKKNKPSRKKARTEHSEPASSKWSKVKSKKSNKSTARVVDSDSELTPPPDAIKPLASTSAIPANAITQPPVPSPEPSTKKRRTPREKPTVAINSDADYTEKSVDSDEDSSSSDENIPLTQLRQSVKPHGSLQSRAIKPAQSRAGGSAPSSSARPMNGKPLPARAGTSVSTSSKPTTASSKSKSKSTTSSATTRPAPSIMSGSGGSKAAGSRTTNLATPAIPKPGPTTSAPTASSSRLPPPTADSVAAAPSPTVDSDDDMRSLFGETESSEDKDIAMPLTDSTVKAAIVASEPLSTNTSSLPDRPTGTLAQPRGSIDSVGSDVPARKLPAHRTGVSKVKMLHPTRGSDPSVATIAVGNATKSAIMQSLYSQSAPGSDASGASPPPPAAISAVISTVSQAVDTPPAGSPAIGSIADDFGGDVSINMDIDDPLPAATYTASPRQMSSEVEEVQPEPRPTAVRPALSASFFRSHQQERRFSAASADAQSPATPQPPSSTTSTMDVDSFLSNIWNQPTVPTPAPVPAPAPVPVASVGGASVTGRIPKKQYWEGALQLGGANGMLEPLCRVRIHEPVMAPGVVRMLLTTLFPAERGTLSLHKTFPVAYASFFFPTFKIDAWAKMELPQDPADADAAGFGGLVKHFDSNKVFALSALPWMSQNITLPYHALVFHNRSAPALSKLIDVPEHFRADNYFGPPSNFLIVGLVMPIQQAWPTQQVPEWSIVTKDLQMRTAIVKARSPHASLMQAEPPGMKLPADLLRAVRGFDYCIFNHDDMFTRWIPIKPTKSTQLANQHEIDKASIVQDTQWLVQGLGKAGAIRVRPKDAALFYFIHAEHWRHLHTFPVLHIRRQHIAPQFWLYGSSPHFHPALQDGMVKQIFPKGGILTLTARVVAERPKECAKLIETVNNHPDWMCYIIPEVLGLLQEMVGDDGTNFDTSRFQDEVSAVQPIVASFLKRTLSVVRHPPPRWDDQALGDWEFDLMNVSDLDKQDQLAILDYCTAELQKHQRSPAQMEQYVYDLMLKDLRQMEATPVMHMGYRRFVVMLADDPGDWVKIADEGADGFEKTKLNLFKFRDGFDPWLPTELAGGAVSTS